MAPPHAMGVRGRPAPGHVAGRCPILFDLPAPCEPWRASLSAKCKLLLQSVRRKFTSGSLTRQTAVQLGCGCVELFEQRGTCAGPAGLCGFTITAPEPAAQALDRSACVCWAQPGAGERPRPRCTCCAGGARWGGQVCKQMVRTDAVSHPLRSTLTTAPEPVAAPDTLVLGQQAVVRLGLPGADRQHRHSLPVWRFCSEKPGGRPCILRSMPAFNALLGDGPVAAHHHRVRGSGLQALRRART